MSIFQLAFAKLRAFARDRRGATAMIYGLAFMPLMIAIGAGVDYARALVVRSNMIEALDAAGLAVGSSPNVTDMQGLAQKYFAANYSEGASFGVPASVTVAQNGQDFTLSTSTSVPTVLMKIVGFQNIPISATVTITRNSKNVEVALALDVTQSMAGSRLTSLQTAANDLINMVVQDTQSPTYSKVAIAPYTTAVNLGSYADQVRGPIKGATAITNVSWAAGTPKTISGATKTNPVVVTANNHGFSNGDVVYIKGVGGMTQLNNKTYTVAGATTNTFQLSGINGGSYSNYSSSSGTATKCQTAACELVVTSNGHGLGNGDNVYITGVGGISPSINQQEPPATVSGVTTNTFVLSGTFGPNYTAYTSGGNAYCIKQGCVLFHFTSQAGTPQMLQASTCVSERTTDAYTDIAPSTTYLGRDYQESTPSIPMPPSSKYYVHQQNPCPTPTIIPLSTSRSALTAVVNGLSAGGSTAGHIGIAWAWYLLSPNFSYLWPSDGQPGAYGDDKLMKFAIIMTDGAFNTAYCKNVISQDSPQGYSGDAHDHINCNAPNNSSSGSTSPGSSAYQALQICSAMKAKRITVYTVGFTVTSDPAAVSLLTSCATDSSHAYFPNSGSDLQNAFHDIAQQITNLRIKS